MGIAAVRPDRGIGKGRNHGAILRSLRLGGVRNLQTDGPIFVQFVSPILRSEFLRGISESGLNGKVWHPDVINELPKLKASKMGGKSVLNEVTRKQRDSFASLGVDVPTAESGRSLVTESWANYGYD